MYIGRYCADTASRDFAPFLVSLVKGWNEEQAELMKMGNMKWMWGCNERFYASFENFLINTSDCKEFL